MRLHVADDGQAAAVPGAVQGAVEHRQPPLVREGLGDVRLGVTHQALELLTGRFDVGPVHRVRLPAPAVAVVRQSDGRLPVKMAARPVVTWSKRAGSSPSTSTAPAAQLPARPMFPARTRRRGASRPTPGSRPPQPLWGPHLLTTLLERRPAAAAGSGTLVARPRGDLQCSGLPGHRRRARAAGWLPFPT